MVGGQLGQYEFITKKTFSAEFLNREKILSVKTLLKILQGLKMYFQICSY